MANGWQKVTFYKALSNPKRLAIVHYLGRKERSVGEIVDYLNVRQANISQHLFVLRQAGLITLRRNGKKVYYHLNKVSS